MSTQSQIQAMIDTLNEALIDAEKFDKGNASAGTRVRKAMMTVKNSAGTVRTNVQAAKNAAKS